jgi:MerR family redox-sensitive transcriptional activator SoxR
MTLFSIGEIARRVGVATSAIRYYERIGLLPPSQRVSGKRRYDASILGHLTIIRVAQEAGFSLAEIDALLHDFPAETPPAERWHAFAGRKIAEQEALIQQAQMRKAFLEKAQECGCSTLEDCAAALRAEV